MNARPSMQARVRDFLAERRRLGFELTNMGRGQREFARYIDARGEHQRSRSRSWPSGRVATNTTAKSRLPGRAG